MPKLFAYAEREGIAEHTGIKISVVTFDDLAVVIFARICQQNIAAAGRTR